jgi:hypothetical protein
MAGKPIKRLLGAAVTTTLAMSIALAGGATPARAADKPTPWGVYDYLMECDGEGQAGLNTQWSAYYCVGGISPYYQYMLMVYLYDEV